VSVVANVAINLDSSGAQQQLRQFQQGVKATDNAVSGLFKTVGKLAIALGAIQAVKFVFVKTAELESQTRSLEVLTGSATKAKQIIQELQQLGAVTPFTSSELIDSAKRLQAFGVETDKVVQTTRRLADVSGATGAELQGLVTAYGQVQAKGRLQGEELLQFQERGVALQGELQKMYGLSGEELRKALEKGRISAEAVEVAINRLTEKGGKYANGAIAQSDTLGGKFSTLIDNIEMLAKKIGKVLEPMLKRILDLSIAVIDKINEAMAGPDRKTANNELFNTRTEIKKLTTEIKAAEKAGIGMSKGLEIKGIDDNVIIPSAPVLPIMKAELTELTKKATYLEGRLKELNLPKAAKEDVKLTVPQLLEEKGGKDKAAREAEKAAKLAKQLAMDSAQYQMQIDDQVFRNQVDLDKLRYDLQRQLQEKQLNNFVNKFTGAAREQAGIIQSMMMGSTSFDAQIKELETKIKEAQQRLQSGARMNQVQSTTVSGGRGGFLVGSTGASSGPHLDLRGSDREGVIREAAAIIKVWQKQGLPYIELPNAKINVKNMLDELKLLQALRKEQMAHDVTRGRPVGASGNAIDISVPSGTKVPVVAGAASLQGRGGYTATSLATGNRMLHGLPQSKAGGGGLAGGGLAGGVPGENVDQTKAEIQGLTQQLALLKSQAKSFQAADLTAGILASTSAFREQTAQLGLQSEAFTLRNRLQMEGVKPELIEGELQVLAVNQRLRDAASALNMDNKDHVAIYNELNQAATTAATAIRAYAEATAAASSPIQQFIGSAQTQLKDLESVAVRVSQGIGDAVGNSLTKGIQGLVEGTTTAQQVFADFLKSIGDILMQEGTKMIATYTAIAIAKSLAGLFGGGGSAIGGGSTYGGAASSSIFSAGTGTAFGGMSIPGFAAGGNPPIGKASLVGEKGPELFVPRTSGTIVPADTTAAMARYQRQGGSSSGNSSSDAMGADAAATPVLSMSFETTRFLGQDYVSTDQLQAAMMATEKRAAAAGAKAGAAQVSSQMRNSPAYRRQVGLR
jgi:tape measure domain-containing protein